MRAILLELVVSGTAVRVCAGVLSFDKTSQNSEKVEEFVAGLRFDHWGSWI
jgi:hypothetical protein